MWTPNRGRGCDELWDCDSHRYTNVWIDNKWEPAVEHRELCLMLCSDLSGKEIQKKERYICIQLFPFSLQQKWIQHCKATIPQLNFFFKKSVPSLMIHLKSFFFNLFIYFFICSEFCHTLNWKGLGFII